MKADDEPEIEVNALEMSPPVQDSAVAMVQPKLAAVLMTESANETRSSGKIAIAYVPIILNAPYERAPA